MNTTEQNAQDTDPEQFIRSTEIEVFGAFMARALSIVRKEEQGTSITDACRLVDAALKAARRDGSMPDAPAATDNSLKGLVDELHAAYEELRTAPAGGEAISAEDEP